MANKLHANTGHEEVQETDKRGKATRESLELPFANAQTAYQQWR